MTGGPLRRATLAEGDLLIVRGDAELAATLAAEMHLAVPVGRAGGRDVVDALFNRPLRPRRGRRFRPAPS